MRNFRRDLLLLRERPYTPLCTPRNRAREMTSGRGRAAAGKNEFLERRQRFVEAVQLLFQPRDVRIGHDPVARDGELAAEIEQLMLDLRQRRAISAGRPATASTTPSALFASSTVP